MTTVPPSDQPSDQQFDRLRADCGSCAALCCVALPFARSADFAFDKAAGVPCRHLGRGFGCDVHDRLPEAGFAGCAAYDCFGAGQRVVQSTFGGRDWRREPDLGAPMFAAFTTMRLLHELLWYLTEALTWAPARPLHARLRAEHHRVEQACSAENDGGDPTGLRASIAPLLRRASALVRGPDAVDRSGADLAGADLRRVDLRRTDLRSASLLGADLRGVDMTYTDLLGADARGADVRGADLVQALFLTQSQLGATRGDAATTIPPALRRPLHLR